MPFLVRQLAACPRAWKVLGAGWLVLTLLGCHTTPVRSRAALYTGPTLEAGRTESGGVAVYWSNPDTNVWLAEWSTNLVHWNYCGNETVYFLKGLRYTETITNWTDRWFVRLRRK